MNEVILGGNLVKDILVKKDEDDNITVGVFTLAVDRDYKNKNGERETDYIDCVCFGNTCENMSKLLKKGDKVVVHGSWRTKSCKMKDGLTTRKKDDLAIDKYFLWLPKKEEK